MHSTDGKKWAIIAGIVAFWLVLIALLGAGSVRSGLRGFIAVILLVALAMGIREKIIVAFQTQWPPAEPKGAYLVISPRSEDGRLTDYYMVGLAREGTRGSVPQPEFGIFSDLQEAQAKADELNGQAGLSAFAVNRITHRWARRT